MNFIIIFNINRKINVFNSKNKINGIFSGIVKLSIVLAPKINVSIESFNRSYYGITIKIGKMNH